MKQLLTAVLLCLTFVAGAQTYEIGHTTITFNDPNRSGGFGSGGGPGRQIQSELYYPAAIAGTDVNLANGEFPVIVFGHGFAMVWDAYANIWEELVPQGYILVFPRTEGGFSPSHDEFGQDLALLVDAMQLQNAEVGSLFFNHVSDKSAIMGHSMGGGATMLAAANNTSIATIIGLAPAETNPSAEQAAADISVPALILSADEDAVTPPAVHHQPIYDNLASSCKYFVNILGGGHCYYANPNFNCDFGETASGGNISITRDEQHVILFRYVLPWLEIYLQGACENSSIFETDISNDNAVTHQSNCTTGLPSVDVSVTENQNELTANEANATYQWLDCANNYSSISGETNQMFTAQATGEYAVLLNTGICMDTSDCYLITAVGLSSATIADIQLYPNPAQGEFTLNVPANGKYRLINTVGQTIDEGTLKAGKNSLHPDCNSGTYLLEVMIDGYAATQKQLWIQ